MILYVIGRFRTVRWRYLFGVVRTCNRGMCLGSQFLFGALWNYKAVFLLRLRKRVLTEDLLNKHLDLCPRTITLQIGSSAGLEPAREVTMGFQSCVPTQ